MAMAYWVRRLVSWFSWFLGRGQTVPEVRAMARERFPDLPESTLLQGEQAALLGLSSVSAANQLPETTFLSAALSAWPEQPATVEVRGLAYYGEVSGRPVFRQYHITVPITMTLGEVRAQLEEIALEGADTVPGTQAPDITIIPPLMEA